MNTNIAIFIACLNFIISVWFGIKLVKGSHDNFDILAFIINVIPAIGALIIGIVISRSAPEIKPVVIHDQSPSAFMVETYFRDLDVRETVTSHRMTVSEIMDLLNKQPNVKTVMIECDPPRVFSLDRLAYPQFESSYQLSQKQWLELQDYCLEKLSHTYKGEVLGAPEVIKHWRSIVAGTPPFGIKVKQ